MRFKYLLFVFAFVFSTNAFLQNTAVPIGGMVHIEGQFVGAENQKLYLLNQAFGGLKNPLYVANTTPDGKFNIDTTIAIRDYYFLRLENGQTINLVLEPGDSVQIYSDAKNVLNYTNIIGSDHSVLMNEYLIEYTSFKMFEDSLRKVLKANPGKEKEVNAYFGPRAQQFIAYRNNFVNANQSSPALIVALNAIDQEKEWEAYKQVVTMLNGSFGDSPSIKNLNGYVKKKNAQVKQSQEQQAALNELFKPGNEALEIELPDTSGNVLKLSSLRGNVVLIDFWASWCGPCRRENPNVVKAYNKYNKDGFEVFSVSLDKNGARERWIAAIKQDGLIWPSHVSDLKGWGSKAAKDYHVKSIPFTVLIDREGKIIGTNLRGPKLEEELKRIFGH